MSGLRVVTVGAPDAAQRLRREPGVELVRAEDPLDAVAELAQPIDADSPARTVAVVGPLPPGEETEFARACRAASPGVVLLTTGETPGCCDGVWSGDAGAIARLFEDRAEAAEPIEPSSAPPTETAASGTDAPPRDETGTATAETDAEHTLLEAMLRGKAPREAVLEAVSARLGVPVCLREEPGEGVEVARHGVRHGWLVAPGADEALVRAEAGKLACWLALEEQIAQLRQAAFVDDLTGAWNRGFFRRYLPRALDAARAGRRDLTLMIYDIDDFKHYNDEFGHGAGDEILTETVRLLRSVVRPTDRVCRIGGDEFAVIFDDPRGARGSSGKHPRSLAAIARRFQQQICRHRFPALAEEAVGTLTISGGMATFPWDGSDPESLIRSADELLLESKRRGKNVITLGRGTDRVCGEPGAGRSEPGGGEPE